MKGKKTGGRALCRIDGSGLIAIKSILNTIKFACDNIPEDELKDSLLKYIEGQHNSFKSKYKDY